VMYVSPAETIDTVDVSTSSFDAEQGMAGGGAVTVITKSGTNNFRGSALEYFNNDKLNAKPYYFNGPQSAAPDNLPVTTNNYGATLGGPIKRNKVFFFGSFEGYKRRQSLFTFFTVPDAALRAGDFSKALNTNGSLQTIYNPFTGNPDGTGRLPFANNVIPSTMIDPIALKILNLYPLPNTPGIGAGGYANNYQRQEDRAVDRENYDAKFNWNRTSTQQLWAKFSHMHAVVDDLTGAQVLVVVTVGDLRPVGGGVGPPRRACRRRCTASRGTSRGSPTPRSTTTSSPPRSRSRRAARA